MSTGLSVRARWARTVGVLLAFGLALGAGACVGLLGLDEFTDESAGSDAGVDASSGGAAADGGTDADAASGERWVRLLDLPEVDGGAQNATMLADDEIVVFVALADGTIEISRHARDDGSVERTGAVHLDGSPGVGPGAAVRLGTDLVVGGSIVPAGDTAQGAAGMLAFVAEGDAGGYSLTRVLVRQESPGTDELWSTAATPSGALIAAGSRAFERWLWLLGPDGQDCAIGGAPGTRGRMVLAEPGGGIFALFNQSGIAVGDAGVLAEGIRVERYQEELCLEAAACGCTPSSEPLVWTADDRSTYVFGAALAGTRLLVAGSVKTPGAGNELSQAIVAQFDATDLGRAPVAVEQSATLQGDGFVHVAADDDHVFVVLLSGWVNEAHSRSFALWRYPIDLADAQQQGVELARWDEGVFAEAEALAVDPATNGGIYLLLLTAADPDAGVSSRPLLMRCDKQQGCPPLP